MKIKIIIAFATFIFSVACTDLHEKLYNQVLAENYGKTPGEIETIVGRAYASLRGFPNDGVVQSFPTCEYVFFLDECVSDEAVIPIRNPGNNWNDGGRYQEAKFHTWTPNNLMIVSSWRYHFVGISKVNQVIYAIDNSNQSADAKAKTKAELRGIRAYYYLRLLDLFGTVPIVTDFVTPTLPKNSTRAQVYAFVESELKDILPNLSSTPIYGRISQSVAYSLLARLYLNAEVYTGQAHWQDCIDACDKVTGYTLEPYFFTNFLTANEVSKEIILSIPYDHKAGTVGNYLSSMSFHYNQKLAFSLTGNWQWSANGICGTPGLYKWFDDKDVRKKSMLFGVQINLATKTPVLMGDGNILDYTDTVTDVANASENEGVRLKKYEVKDGESWERDHDWVLIRYSEILLMKAECLTRLGSADLAQPLVKQVRTRAGLDTPDAVDLQFINDELKREFLFEAHRRTDNIRFGDFFKAGWSQNVTPAYRGIFPVPAEEMAKNSNLVQNPGY
jgi:starch-binding outer membrane protein, SusD/RagB family